MYILSYCIKLNSFSVKSGELARARAQRCCTWKQQTKHVDPSCPLFFFFLFSSFCVNS